MELAQRIEHTLLKPEATVKDIMRLCDEAQKYHLVRRMRKSVLCGRWQSIFCRARR